MTKTRKILLIILALILLSGAYLASRTAKKTAPPSPPARSNSIEQQHIDAWIESNHLNTYGDRSDTNYPGGTPLFNETTGQSEARYNYIMRQHPDKPWNR